MTFSLILASQVTSIPHSIWAKSSARFVCAWMFVVKVSVTLTMTCQMMVHVQSGDVKICARMIDWIGMFLVDADVVTPMAKVGQVLIVPFPAPVCLNKSKSRTFSAWKLLWRRLASPCSCLTWTWTCFVTSVISCIFRISRFISFIIWVPISFALRVFSVSFLYSSCWRLKSSV